MSTIIKADGLTKSYVAGVRELNVLRGIDLEIGQGEAVCLLGASGAGKSTLLHILSSIDQPTSGRVFYEGQDLSTLSDSSLAHLRNKELGFVFQFHYLLPEFTALENVMIPLLIGGTNSYDASRMALETLTSLGLADRSHHRPAELSGGEQQRIAVARAIVPKPKVIFADEPTGNLDSETGKTLFGLLVRLSEKEGRTLIVATHNETLARMIKRRVLLADGRISEAS